MRTLRLSSALLAAMAVSVAPAAAKDGVVAKLDAPVRLNAAPGATLTVAWRLVDAQGRPFGASGIYLRVSRCRGAALIVPATERGQGRYRARLTVPRGGIRRLVVGLEGWRTSGPGEVVRADHLFSFARPLARRC